MPAREIFDVVIVGFGPAGATCANLLGSYGLRTLAIDRSREVFAKPRAFALDHEIMRVFQNLGLADAILPHTAPFTPSEYYGAGGQLIKRLGSIPPPYPLGWPPNMVFNQPPIEGGFVCADRHPANGTLFPQPTVRRPEGDRLLDEIAGSGLRVILGGALSPPTPAIRNLAESAGARLVCFGAGDGLQESGDVLAGWFEKYACAAAIVRPDHYVYGVAATAPDLERQLRALPGQLGAA